MRALRTILAFLLCVYLVPGLAAAGLWAARERPANWREAKWTSSHTLPDPATSREARVTIFAATTGGFKGAFSVHSWIVVKAENAERYDRYDVVGWGSPVAVHVGDHDEIIVSSERSVYAYDPASGQVLWTCAGNLVEVTPTPAVGHGLIFCCSGRVGPTP